MNLKYYIFLGISITIFMMGVIVYPTINIVTFVDDYPHDIPTALANISQIISEKNYQFIDFSYTQTIGEPIKFILEKTSYSNCNSFNAEITDKDGNFVWGGGAYALCDPNDNPSLVTSQIKIGYNEDNPIIINESGKYFIEIEVDNVIIKREFVVRQNQGGVNIDTTPETESIIDERCGVDTVSIDEVCQVVKVEKTKTVGDDAPFFGIFVYLDNLISGIFGK